MSKTKSFVVRSFEPRAGAWDCTGVMENLATFTETVSPVHDVAVEDMMEFSELGEKLRKVNISFKIDQVFSYGDARSFRSIVRESLKRWAEKSRVKGARGWRTNAVREVEVGKDGTFRATIILGTNIYYKYDGKKLLWVPGHIQSKYNVVDDLSLLQSHLEQSTHRAVSFMESTMYETNGFERAFKVLS